MLNSGSKTSSKDILTETEIAKLTVPEFADYLWSLDKIENFWKLVHKDENHKQFKDFKNIDGLYHDEGAYIWRRTIFLNPLNNYQAFDYYCHVEWKNASQYVSQKCIKFIYYKDKTLKKIINELEDENSGYKQHKNGTVEYNIIMSVYDHLSTINYKKKLEAKDEFGNHIATSGDHIDYVIPADKKKENNKERKLSEEEIVALMKGLPKSKETKNKRKN